MQRTTYTFSIAAFLKSYMGAYMGARFFPGGGAGGGVSHFRGRRVKFVDPIFDRQFFSKNKKNQQKTKTRPQNFCGPGG
jgi:hypothetical protein